jgi:hypothetical protein
MTDQAYYIYINGHQIAMEGLDKYVVALNVGSAMYHALEGKDHLILHEGLNIDEMRAKLIELHYVSSVNPDEPIQVMTVRDYLEAYPERHGHKNYIGPYKKEYNGNKNNTIPYPKNTDPYEMEDYTDMPELMDLENQTESKEKMPDILPPTISSN